MDTAAWFVIAQIIIPSIIAILTASWQVRTMRALAKPVADQQGAPKTKLRKKILLVLFWAFVTMGFFILPIRNLYMEFTSSEPFDRSSALSIASSIATISFGAMIIIWFIGLGKTITIFKSQSSINQAMLSEMDKLRRLLTRS